MVMDRFEQCSYYEELKCSFKDFFRENSTYKLINDHTRVIVFKTPSITRTICSGIEFQVFTWGSKTYTIWILPGGVVKCVFLKNVYLVPLNSEILYTTMDDGVEQVCGELGEIIEYWSYLKKLLPYEPKVLFLVDQRVLNEDISYHNIVYYRGVESILRNIEKLISSKIHERGKALKYLELIKQKAIRPDHIWRMLSLENGSLGNPDT